MGVCKEWSVIDNFNFLNTVFTGGEKWEKVEGSGYVCFLVVSKFFFMCEALIFLLHTYTIFILKLRLWKQP
jgi:hypothetical protein